MFEPFEMENVREFFRWESVWNYIKRAYLAVSKLWGAIVLVLLIFMLIMRSVYISDTEYAVAQVKCNPSSSTHDEVKNWDTSGLFELQGARKNAIPPVDVVYTWVNGSDPVLKNKFHTAKLSLRFLVSRLDTKQMAKEDHCESYYGSRLVLIPKDYLIKNNVTRPTPLAERIKMAGTTFSEFELFVFSSPTAAKHYVKNGWKLGVDKTAQVFYAKNCTEKPNGEKRLVLSVNNALRIEKSNKYEMQLASQMENNLRIKQVDYILAINDMHYKIYAFSEYNQEMLNEARILVSKGGFELSPVNLEVRLITAFDYFHINQEAISENRFRDNGELKYSLRSLEKFAPWVNHIYIVTDDQTPNWLNVKHPKITMISHQSIFSNATHLPTFNSAAIEQHIKNIPNLSRFFLYFNDDMLLGKPVYLSDFMNERNEYKFRMAWQLPECSTGCSRQWIKDGFCDAACNNTRCMFDGGDCQPKKLKQIDIPRIKAIEKLMNDKLARKSETIIEKRFYRNLRHLSRTLSCSPYCKESWLNDQICDAGCNNFECGWDVGDCGTELLKNITTRFWYDVDNYRNEINGIKFYPNISTAKPLISVSFDRLINNFDEFIAVHKLKKNVDKQKLNELIASKPIQKNNFTITEIICITPKVVDAVTYDPYKKTMFILLQTDVSFNHEISFEVTFFFNQVEATIELNFNVTHLNRFLYEEYEKVYASKIKNITYAENVNITDWQPLDGYMSDDAANYERTKMKLEINQTNAEEYFEFDDEEDDEYFRKAKKPGFLVSGTRGAFNSSIPPPTTHDQLIDHLKTWRHNHFTTADDSLEFEPPLDPESGQFLNRRLQKHEYDAVDMKPRWGNILPESTNQHINPYFPINSTVGKLVNTTLTSETYVLEHRLSGNSRFTLDTYSDSLVFSDNVLTQHFGYKKRKVPAHMPLLVDQQAAERIHHQYKDLVDRTSSHKFRHESDLQFAFFYVYFLSEELIKLKTKEIVETVDTDNNKYLDKNELHSLVARLSSPPSNRTEIKIFWDEICNCTKVANTTKEILIENLEKCEKFATFIQPFFNMMGRNKIQFMGSNDVGFVMIKDNLQDLRTKLDIFRIDPPMFLTFNDDLITDNKTLEKDIQNELISFYEWLYPKKSSFEL